MKLIENLKQKKNKGFTLIELIIVIAIMAVLLGIVGTQVIPYLERTKEAKDLQIINSYCTAAVSVYAFHIEDFVESEEAGADLWGSVYDEISSNPTGAPNENKINSKIDGYMDDVIEFVGYSNVDSLKSAMLSKKSEDIADIVIVIEIKSGYVLVQAVDSNGKPVLDSVISGIGHSGN